MFDKPTIPRPGRKNRQEKGWEEIYKDGKNMLSFPGTYFFTMDTGIPRREEKPVSGTENGLSGRSSE